MDGRAITNRSSRAKSMGKQLGQRRQELGPGPWEKDAGGEAVRAKAVENPGWVTRPKGQSMAGHESGREEPTGLMTAALPMSACRHSSAECLQASPGTSAGYGGERGGGGFTMESYEPRLSRNSCVRHI